MNRILITLVIAVAAGLSAKAILVVDGIYYDIDMEKKTAIVWDTDKCAFDVEWIIEGIDSRPWHNYDNAYSGDIVIPEKITVDGEEYTVTAIAAGAFAQSKELTSVTMPNTITEVMIGAFNGCTNLREIKFSNQTRGVRNETLQGCTSLTKLDLSGIQDFVVLWLDNLPNLTDVVLPENAIYYSIHQSENAQPCNFYINSPYPPFPLYIDIKVSKNSVLYVPEGGPDYYDLILGRLKWPFGDIREMDFSSAEVPEVKAQRYCLNGNTLTAGSEERVEVYDIQGRLATVLAAGKTTSLASGAYVLRCGDRSDKVLVR